MGFYYISIFSIMLLLVIYAVLFLLYLGVARLTRGMPGRKALLLVVGVAFLLLPIGEELWIAWNFGQACKQAGTFVYKKVEADGFYDDTRTTHAGKPTNQAAASFNKLGYRFLEMKGPNGGVVHLEKADGQWRATIISHPTARYHYRTRDHIPVSLKVVKHESVVTDTQEQQVIGREIIVGRYPPWFFIGLDVPQLQCFGSHLPGLIYRNVLLPK